MTDRITKWIQDRRDVQVAATGGEWTATIADLENPLDATIVDSDECNGMWIASSDDDERTAENAYAIVDAHNEFPKALTALESVLTLAEELDASAEGHHDGVANEMRANAWRIRRVIESALEETKG